MTGVEGTICVPPQSRRALSMGGQDGILQEVEGLCLASRVRGQSKPDSWAGQLLLLLQRPLRYAPFLEQHKCFLHAAVHGLFLPGILNSCPSCLCGLPDQEEVAGFAQIFHNAMGWTLTAQIYPFPHQSPGIGRGQRQPSQESLVQAYMCPLGLPQETAAVCQTWPYRNHLRP